MEVVTKKIFLLSHCKGISNQLLSKLLKVDPSLNIVHMLKDEDWKRYFNMSKEKVVALKKEYNSLHFDSLYQVYKNKEVSFITHNDKSFPPLLKEISDPPPILYYIGDLSLSHSSRVISVVGTRHPNQYGKSVLKHLLKPLIMDNWAIVSGLAAGIDTLAHETAMNNGGRTVAVIAGGLFHLYPKQNIPLAKRMMTDHLILSEHPPSFPPQKWHFPMRNRIISGLSLGTIIIQAKKRSGSLITAQQALEQNREVFAVPGSIFDDFSVGTNELIQSGAKLVQNAGHILEEFADKVK